MNWRSLCGIEIFPLALTRVCPDRSRAPWPLHRILIAVAPELDKGERCTDLKYAEYPVNAVFLKEHFTHPATPLKWLLAKPFSPGRANVTAKTTGTNGLLSGLCSSPRTSIPQGTVMISHNARAAAGTSANRRIARGVVRRNSPARRRRARGLLTSPNPTKRILIAGC